MAYGSIKVDSITSSTQTVAVDDLLAVADIGAAVQAYDADTAKYDAATANFTGTLQNGGSNVVVDSDIGVSVQPYDANTAKLGVAQTYTAAQTFSAGASDSSGSFRAVPQHTKSAAYTLVASDTGKHISISSGGITLPQGTFSAGDVVSVFNNSSSAQTISAGGTTLRKAGSADTGDRTLAQYGIATILCVSSNTFVISGAGLS